MFELGGRRAPCTRIGEREIEVVGLEPQVHVDRCGTIVEPRPPCPLSGRIVKLPTPRTRGKDRLRFLSLLPRIAQDRLAGAGPRFVQRQPRADAISGRGRGREEPDRERLPGNP